MKMMNRIIQVNLFVFAIFIISVTWIGFNTAYAQIGNFEINPAQIQVPPECSEVTIRGDKANIPFQLKVFIDFSRDANITFEQKGKTIARTHTSPELLIFESDDPDEYQIKAFANYDTDKIRAMYVQYLTKNNANFEEIIPYEGKGFCRIWNIKTTIPEKIPTKTEIIGEQAERAFEEMPLIKDAINRNTSAQSASINWLFIAVVAALGVSVSQLFVYVSRKRKDKQRGTAFDNMIKVGSKHIANFKKEHDEIKKLREQFSGFIDTAQINLNSMLLDFRKNNSLPIEITEEQKEEIAEETSVLRKIYQSTSDENLKKVFKIIKDKTGKLAERNKSLIKDEIQKRETQPKEEEIDIKDPEEEDDDIQTQEDNGLPTQEEAQQIIDEYGNKRYRELSDDEMRFLYRAYDKMYRIAPNDFVNKKLNKISEILNIRAIEQSKKNGGSKNE